MRKTAGSDFMTLVRSIVSGEGAKVREHVPASPDLVRKPAVTGASRQVASEYFFPESGTTCTATLPFTSQLPDSSSNWLSSSSIMAQIVRRRTAVEPSLCIRIEQPLPVGFENCCASGPESRIHVVCGLVRRISAEYLPARLCVFLPYRVFAI
jgi:hypothetical protein